MLMYFLETVAHLRASNKQIQHLKKSIIVLLKMMRMKMKMAMFLILTSLNRNPNRGHLSNNIDSNSRSIQSQSNHR